ncbi:EF-P beta-lysylation protein EpmB [Thiomicrorhabdus sediminis]|uniref:L-lysine 2,3-aminomutase n=1 Tax=Thiomicrorhabdus sediminis TaxID=2580412 RepID=A0A4P9K6J5_9GAMM|nr:EF-P beta-lysylation protein EpmB [Thiomicrorhabdus sediminis]QCU90675.1 EF-P beta-lysylation protein EpmB [Thiomicrorhabdus sediminis]
MNSALKQSAQKEQPAKTMQAVNKMLARVEISSEQIPLLAETAFAFKAPQHFIEQIKKQPTADNPLLKQILPVAAELDSVPGYSEDPVADLTFNPQPSLIHKYHGRALMIASPKCDIHCRYCFRRHFPYEEQVNQRHWQSALDAVKADSSIHELILSGGDPMSLSENALMKLIRLIDDIEQIKTLRIHSRTPVAAPDQAPRQQFLSWLKNTRLKVVLVVHCNHADELSTQTEALFNLYRQAGVTLLNQSVLLKGVNDNVETLQQLSHKLFEQGVLPYYLNQLDKVAGSAHFEVNDEQAIALHKELRGLLPGYLLPKLVKDIVGRSSKTPLA